MSKRGVDAGHSPDRHERGKNHHDVSPDIARPRHQQRDGEIKIHLIFERPADIDDGHLAIGEGDEPQRLEDVAGREPVRRAERGRKRHGQDRHDEDDKKIERHDALDPAAQELRRRQSCAMGRIKNDEARNDEEKIDATAAVRQRERDGAVGNLEALRCDARGMKGDDRNGREKPEHLDMDEHPCD